MKRSIGPFQVAPIGLGGMPLSLRGRPPEADGVRVIHAALDAGIDLIDTADAYCVDDGDTGHNERLIARALAQWSGPRESVLVATKGGCERPGGDWTTNGRPEHLRRACERSLTALGVERIGLYQLHAPDDDTPFEDSVGALAALRAEGKIAEVGLSNVNVAEIEAARRIVPVVSVQNRCGWLDLSDWETGVIPYCEAHGIAYLAYSPVNGGEGKGWIASEPLLRAVGAELGATPFQVALAWLCAQSPVIVPIPGASRVSSATSSAAAMRLVLPPAQRARLDAARPASMLPGREST